MVDARDENAHLRPSRLWTIIIGNMNLHHLDAKWSVDAAAFSGKATSWSTMQRLALIDAVERWTILVDEQLVQPDQALVDVGLVCACAEPDPEATPE
jgi:hypothetical protein